MSLNTVDASTNNYELVGLAQPNPALILRNINLSATNNPIIVGTHTLFWQAKFIRNQFGIVNVDCTAL